MKYLDPKADLTFKKIFGNHPKRLISLLNALLPLSEEEQIHEIEYLPTELVPQLEGGMAVTMMTTRATKSRTTRTRRNGSRTFTAVFSTEPQ